MHTPESPRERHQLARAAAIGMLTLTALTTAASAHAANHPHPAPRDGNGNLTNSVTSNSPGANCVTGTEPGCTTTIGPVIAAPLGNPLAAAPLAAAGTGAYLLLRRRRTQTR